MTRTETNPGWAELVQLVPVVSLAAPFLVVGEVDLSRAGAGFAVAAALSIPVQALVLARGHLLNPILVGTALWLIAGAIAFAVPIAPAARWIADTQAVGLFAAALAVGVVTTAVSPWGFVGARGDPARIRRASAGLLALAAVAVAWSWVFRHDLRLGGGLPFIVLNVVRRVTIARGVAR